MTVTILNLENAQMGEYEDQALAYRMRLKVMGGQRWNVATQERKVCYIKRLKSLHLS